MKTIKRSLLAAALLITTAYGATAQSTANATATATILTAISITKTVDMNFGNISVQAATGGTVILSTAGVRSTTGGVTLPATGGTVTAASFTIGGEGAYTYSVTAFLSNPSGTGTLTGGAQTLTVGATLTISAAQATGLYTSETGFNVTVNYN
jgi:hypothetical protein